MYHPNNEHETYVLHWFGERHKIYTHIHKREIKMLQFIIAIDANGK